MSRAEAHAEARCRRLKRQNLLVSCERDGGDFALVSPETYTPPFMGGDRAACSILKSLSETLVPGTAAAQEEPAVGLTTEAQNMGRVAGQDFAGDSHAVPHRRI